MEKVCPWPILGLRMAKEQNSVTYSGQLINSCSGSWRMGRNDWFMTANSVCNYIMFQLHTASDLLCWYRFRKTTHILWPEHQLHGRWAFPMSFYQVGNSTVVSWTICNSQYVMYVMLPVLVFFHYYCYYHFVKLQSLWIPAIWLRHHLFHRVDSVHEM